MRYNLNEDVLIFFCGRTHKSHLSKTGFRRKLKPGPAVLRYGPVFLLDQTKGGQVCMNLEIGVCGSES
jgi:hypothetical protein